MEPNIFINAMYFMSMYGFCNPISNRRRRMNFVKAKLKNLKHRKENSMITTIVIILVIALFYCLYILYRNKKVCNFQIEIARKCFGVVILFLQSLKDDDEFHKQHCQYETLKEKADEIMDKHSYASMLFSFKPLKLESWFTKEEIDFMNLNVQKGE